MKKTLLLGTVLLVGVAGFAQSTANKVHSSPAYLQKRSVYAQGKMAAESLPSNTPGIKTAKKGGNNSINTTCNGGKIITTSYNCFGVGGGSYTSTQNCLSYNKDLKVAMWTQRGSKKWALNTTSGHIQGTIINVNTLATDSIIIYKDANASHHGRYPGGVLLNPTSNTSNSYTNAIAVAIAPTTDGANWLGTAYSAKPLWSASALTHTVVPAGDSLWTNGSLTNGAIGAFGNTNTTTGTLNPTIDMLALPDGKTVLSIGEVIDNTYSAVANATYFKKALIARGTLNSTGKAVNWTVDSTSLQPPVHIGLFGELIVEPRMAFSPDGNTGYVVFLGRLATAYGNGSADSTYSPIVYKSTDAGVTWTQKMAGYDWKCKHPEVDKNVGELKYSNLPNGNKRLYNFSPYSHGADVVVDANGKLHFVTTLEESLHLTTGDIDSLAFSSTYHYDYITYHPIIWDFITDGNDWQTLFVDSILTAPFASSTNTLDSTHTISPMGGASGLAVTSHITVSRSTDGTKIFYGWADSDPNVVGPNATNGASYNSSPDLQVVAYDVNTNKISAKKTITSTGNAFYPFLSDQSYFDAGQSAWVVPAVYTAGDVITTATPYNIYDASAQADYFYTNCGTFTAADFNTTALFFTAPTGTTCSTAKVSIEKVNQFAASVSNYPNPFSNTTTIAVTLTESKSFSVTIYNAIGTLVYSKKVNGNVGENNVTFDGGTLSSGVYYYTVNAGNQQATKKMIIQK